MSTRPVRRSHVDSNDGGKPVASMGLRLRLRAAVRIAPYRPGLYPVRPRHLWHDPPETAEDRRADPYQRAPYHGCHGLGLSVPAQVRAGACLPATSRGLNVTKQIPQRRHEPTSNTAQWAVTRSCARNTPRSRQIWLIHAFPNDPTRHTGSSRPWISRQLPTDRPAVRFYSQRRAAPLYGRKRSGNVSGHSRSR